MRVQFSPTPHQKQTILEAFFYEVEQLLDASSTKTHNTCLNNALLESTLVHARILLDFYERPTRTIRHEGKQQIEMDDVLAVDYGFPARQVEIPPVERERLNKDLAHLTYSRADRRPEDKGWDYRKVVYPILTRSKEFIEHLLFTGTASSDPRTIEGCKLLIRRIEDRLKVAEHGIRT